MNPEHVKWCKSLFATIKDGGAWAVPRSGLVFRKEGKTLKLVALADGISADASADLAAIKEHFAAAGIKVE